MNAIRNDFVRFATAAELDVLRSTVREHEAALEAWLAGAEASSRKPTEEYVAFTAMLMIVDTL